jgi:WD40 repeat protein
VATVAFSGQPALWNVTDLSKPARITTLPSGDDGKLWGEAFSPDGRILAAAYTDRLDLWNVTDLARPRLVRTLAAPVAPPWRALFNQGDIAFSPDGRLLASTAGHDQLPDTHWHAGPRNQPAAPASPVSRACSFRQSRLPDRATQTQLPNARTGRSATPRREMSARQPADPNADGTHQTGAFDLAPARD